MGRLLLLAALAVGIWWLFFRRAPATGSSKVRRSRDLTAPGMVPLADPDVATPSGRRLDRPITDCGCT